MYYKQLTSEQRSQIFVLLQKRTARKDIASLVGISESTLSRELKRNSSNAGHYIWRKANDKAMERRKRTTSNPRKDSIVVWEALDYLQTEQWSPKQDYYSRSKRMEYLR
jgi:IS30 family transposase